MIRRFIAENAGRVIEGYQVHRGSLMAWLWLFAAGFFEIVFAISLRLSEGFTKPLFTSAFLISAACAFFCLSKAMQTIPIGTAYTVWTGIGAAGVVLFGIVYFNEPATALRMTLIATLVASIIGLKLTAAG